RADDRPAGPGSRVPRRLRRPGDRRADGHRPPAPLRPGHGAVAGHWGCRRRVPRHPHHVDIRERAGSAAVRLRGGDHRRAGLALGHAGGRRGAGHRADRRRQALAGVGDPERPPRLPRRPAPAPAGPLREGAEGRVSPLADGAGVRVERTTPASRAGLVVGAGGLLALVAPPRWGDPSTMRILVEFIALLVLAQMWNLLAGYAGLVSIGQQAYVGLGGDALIVLADDLGVNPFLAVPLAGVAAALIALPTAALVFRFRGGYFAVGTWAVAGGFRLLVAKPPGLR